MPTTKQALITSRDDKGVHAVRLFEAVYNKAKLDEDRAQRLNERGGELQARIREAIEEFSVTDRYKDEEGQSTYTYPSEYRGPKPIMDQVNLLAQVFGLSIELTMEFIEKMLPTLVISESAEGPFAFPSVDALARINAK